MDFIFLKLRAIIKSRVPVTLAALSFLFIACQADDGKRNDRLLNTAKIDNLILQLHSKQGKCVLEVNGNNNSELLSVPYPCGFVRAGKEGVAQTHFYEEVGHVLVVAGPPVDNASYTKGSGVNPEHHCSNDGQAIIVNKGKIIQRKAENVPLGFCHYLGFDEKVFYGYAYPVE